MLTRMTFKNWRSLRDVTIDFTSITLFIGANSSGKTNILGVLLS
jgi:AAA15 family ATPase/GTPase